MRRLAREVALQILFQIEFAPAISISDLLEVYEDKSPYNKDVLGYADSLVRGVKENLKAVDELIQKSSAHWKLERMASVDRNILRVATYELKFSAEPPPPKVVINEAIEIAKLYGTTESAAFINGILDQINKVG